MNLSYVSALRTTNIYSYWWQRSITWRDIRPAILNYIQNKAWILGAVKPNIWLIHSQKWRMKSTTFSHHFLFSWYKDQFGMKRRIVWWYCKRNSITKATIRLQSRNVFWRMKPQRPNSFRNKRHRILQVRTFNRKKSKAAKSMLQAFILVFIPVCQWKQQERLSISLDSGRDHLPHFCWNHIVNMELRRVETRWSATKCQLSQWIARCLLWRIIWKIKEGS